MVSRVTELWSFVLTACWVVWSVTVESSDGSTLVILKIGFRKHFR